MNRKIRFTTGVFLIFISVFAMIFWESYGREAIMNDDVIVAARQIEAGEICAAEDLLIKSIPKDAIVAERLTTGNVNDYLGKKFKYDINENSQIGVNFFISEKNDVPKGMSLFLLKKDWIMNISNSLRKGDYVEIYSYDYANTPIMLGEYYIAFVKDSNGREVINTTGFEEPDILERTDAVSVPVEVEIAASLENYERIAKEAASGKEIILVQKGVGIYE